VKNTTEKRHNYFVAITETGVYM